VNDQRLTVGQYEVVEKLGRGSMGWIWRVKLPGTEQEFAAKVMTGENEEALGRFQREAYISQRLRHEHVVHVFEGGVLRNGRPWLVMELLHGESLEERLARTGPLPFEEALDWLEQLLDGLEAVHEAGIVHRDLKPANLQIEGDAGAELLKILDFGVARVLDQEEVAREELFTSVEGELSGTPQYVAPDALMDPSVVVRGHDVYACGVILYEMLTGRLPYPKPRTLSHLLQCVMESAVPSLDEAHPEGAPFPPAVERLVRRLLEKDTELRPVDAGAALEALAEAREAMSAAAERKKGISGRLRGMTRRFLGGGDA
jgi:serine/threonine-protein kinase